MDTEEFSRGLLAREVLDGPAFALLDYQGDPYAGGSLLMGLLAVPLFALFGDSLFVLKLVTLPFLFGTALAFFVLLSRHVDRRAGLLVAALFILAPYPSSRLALVAWGDNVQVPLFMALALLPAWPIVREDGRAPPGFAAPALGFVAGFGVWYHYHAAVPLLLVGLFLLLTRPRALLGRPLLLMIAGFLVGFSPWFVYNLGHRWEGLNISSYGSLGDMGSGALARYPGRLLGLLTHIPAASLGPGPAMWPWALAASVVVFLIFVGAWAFLIREEGATLRTLARLGAGRTPPTASGWLLSWFLVYPLFFALIAAALPFRFENRPAWYFADRYLASVHAAIFVVLSVAAVRLWDRGAWRRWIAAAGMGFVLLVGVGAQVVILAGDPPVQPQAARHPDGSWIRGYVYHLLADDRVAFAFYRGDLARNLEILRSSGEARRGPLARALGMSLVWRLGADPASLRELLAREGPVDATDLPRVWEGIGYGTGRWRSEALPEALAAMDGTREERHFLTGLIGSMGSWHAGDPARVAETLATRIPPAWAPRFWFEHGRNLSTNSKRDLGLAARFVLETVPRDAWDPVLRGLCEDLRPRMVDPITTRDTLAALDTLPDPGMRTTLSSCLKSPRPGAP
jgi:hypothetical protein